MNWSLVYVYVVNAFFFFLNTSVLTKGGMLLTLEVDWAFAARPPPTKRRERRKKEQNKQKNRKTERDID